MGVLSKTLLCIVSPWDPPLLMEGDDLSSPDETLAKAEELERPTVRYRLYKRRFAGLVALVSRAFRIPPFM